MKCCHCNLEFIAKRKDQVYCSKSCASVKKGLMRRGQKTGAQVGREYKKQIDKDGYLRVYARHHPYSFGRLLMQEHVMVMELHLGRRLNAEECVHHINHVKTDNRLENLALMTKSEHSKLHSFGQQRQRDLAGRYA